MADTSLPYRKDLEPSGRAPEPLLGSDQDSGGRWACPYCGQLFMNYDEAQEHIWVRHERRL